MSGLYSNGVPQASILTGAELLPCDTELLNGANPQSASVSLFQLCTAMSYLVNNVDKTTVAGTRYYGSVSVGFAATFTGVQVRVGSVGGTDLWIAELHDSTGALVATSTTSGTTAGTASTWQRLAFTAAYTAQPGTYYIALQSNGTTAKASVYASAGLPITSGSATGTFGTGASITPPTTYTASLAPVAQLY